MSREMRPFAERFRCEECRRIVRTLRDAWQADTRDLRTKLQGVATTSGRDPRQLGVGWVFSIARMPDEEMKALLESHYPHVAVARRLRDDHEAASGHSVWLHGSWLLMMYGSDEFV